MSNILKGLIFEEEQTSYSIHLKDNDKPLLKYNSISELKSAYAGLTKKYPDREFTIKKTSCSTTELGRPEFLESAQKISEEELNEDLRKWFKEKWVRFGPDGKIRGDCARGDDSEGKPKCLPQAKAHSLGKAGRKYAASKKRREDPNPERSGPAKNVATKKKSNESMSADLDRDEEEFIPQIYASVIPGTKSFLITKVLDANLGLKVGDKVSYIALTSGKFKGIPKSLSYKQDVSEEQLDELKCWPGYSRVQGVPAGAPGSCKKKTTESLEDLVQIEFWQQDTQESGHWAKTKPMSRTKAEQILSSFPRGEIVNVDQDVTEEKCPHCNGPMFSEALMNEKQDACYYKVKSRYKVWPSAYASGALVKCRKKGAKNWGNKSESAIMRGLQSESLGTQYPTTYEEENEPFKSKGQRRTGTLTTEEELDEKWSNKYKRSIDCSHPKGFSQRAHCQGKKK
jgi:hypothetical protein